jgi:PAS domain S-box-containing protein
VTMRKRSEEERAKFISIIDSAPSAIVVLNADGTAFYVNRAFEAVSGLAQSQAVGQYYESLMHRLYANKLYSIPWERLQSGESCVDTVAFEGVDGTFRMMDQTISPIFSSNGDLVNYVLFTRDITQERELEIRARWADERLRLSIDGMVDGLTLWDAHLSPTGDINEFVCSEANPAALLILGRERHEAIGLQVRDLLDGVEDYDLHDLFQRVHTRGKPVIIEHLHYHKNGSRSVLTIHVWAVGTGVACHLHDVTKQLELETQLRQAQKLEAVGSLAAGIAHEINTPIQFVGDNIRFLADSFMSMMKLLESHREFREAMFPMLGEREELQVLRQMKKQVDIAYLLHEIPQAVEQSLEGVQRVSTIVRAMKDFSHRDEGEMALGDINSMLETTLTVARNELKYVANVVREYANDLPQVECFRNDLNQVFLNLLINAAHAIHDVVGDSGQQRGIITVGTRLEGDEVVISIADTGPGIPVDIRDRIFEHFFTTKEVGKGTGQGLAIARSIMVDKHKGSITFDTELGKGTIFHVRVPIIRREVALART